jgi:cytochrome P450
MDNLVPIAYWLLYVLLSSPERLATFRCSIDTARLSSKHEGLPRFDVGKLAQDAYLCSLLHEVLRVHVTSLIARRVEQDVEIGENQLPKGSIALVAPWIQHRNTARCERGLGMEKHSVHEFWGERFLSEGKGGPEFSKKAAGVAFMAFGMGTHRCPGRRFATGAILSIVATLISVFEFAPPEREDWPHAELRHSTFGYTPARPAEPVQFRVRKRDT